MFGWVGRYDSEQQRAGCPLSRASWIGGQGTSPKEQKTQQSPAFGRRSAPHPVHS